MTASESYMHRCFQLARLGAGHVAPNPMVGAVLVHNDVIIGEGYHQQYGNAHAEVNCINSVKTEHQFLIDKSTLYVSLEPCSHFGKTPPCTDLIIRMKIPRVVIGCSDSYKEVNGKGVAKLKAAGVEVTAAVLEKEAIDLNKRFFTFHKSGRPYIILKWAQSKDGHIANADYSRLLISNDFTNRLVHNWRSEEAAIMIGTNTALCDNPSLTTRLWPGNNPLRVVIDKNLRLPASNHLLSDQLPTIVFNEYKTEVAGSVSYHRISFTKNSIDQILHQLYLLNVQSVILEGGAKLLQSFIEAGIFDEARIITNNKLIIGNGIPAPVLKNHILIQTSTYFTDTIDYYSFSNSR